ncbi:FAD-dependent oxidoreductase [Paucibacter sp. KCTC 42545]|uniref:FAD-dependent oxidoreductase n=1 Tax=Paucibacter sp. KCTC 42545 TaxID=1768242 RepID=UPI000733BAB2|nr:FAD-dependent oxidoreductase [Paucibacter sp. KCTC 42545]ALT75862.1 hypothetical protein AT984_00130 [Paucibacter sp. KCTC 42545]
MTRLHADVLVVGAGPAGIAVVCQLAEAGKSVIWIDAGAAAGGQIWRAQLPARWQARLKAVAAKVQHLAGHAVVSPLPAAAGQQALLLQSQQDPSAAAFAVQAPNVLLATGARERFIPFPGWTLPGVTGAGGLQALVKQGWPLKGKRVVVAGSGPLLLATAHTLQSQGCTPSLIAEQASKTQLSQFALRLDARFWAQAASMAWQLRRVPFQSGTWVLRALGEEKLEAVVLSDGRREWTQACDALALGYGLLPNTELAALLGCALQASAIQVDQQLQTSVPGVYAAGECTGIAGVDKALAEGGLAAQSILGQQRQHAPAALRRARRHGQLLAQIFALRPELLQLAEAKTIICRCEDVSLGELKAQRSWREAKLQTRCGMGACQGRICGPICQDLLGWPAGAGERAVRAPLQPTPISAFLSPGVSMPADTDQKDQGDPSIL